jgi:hypothetical protein
MWPQGFSRYLTLDGEPAFHIGNICGTCEFLFERLQGASDKVSAAECSSTLRAGLDAIPPEPLAALLKLVPAGEYIVSLLKVQPRKVSLGSGDDYFCNEQLDLWGVDSFWGLPHYPKVEYYRSQRILFDGDNALFDFLVPMYPPTMLHEETIAEYMELLAGGRRPTAVALSVLDVKQPWNWGDAARITKHWCLAHYLIDGHHKTFAASQLVRPITLLSLLAVGECVAKHDEIERLLQVLGRDKTW